MGKRKYKRGTRKRKITQKVFYAIFAVFLVCMVIFGVFQFLSNPITAVSPPAYEEVYSISSDLNREIRKIDRAIYESLYHKEIPENNVLFSAVKPKHEKDYDWDFTELVIKLPPQKKGFDLKKVFNVKFSQLKPSVSYKTEKISPKEIAWRLYALGFYTHKLRLITEDLIKKDHGDLPKIVIIIDDLGYDCSMATAFIQCNIPISLSILPSAPYTEYLASMANKKGKELILHLPMEPKNYPSVHPGPGTLLTSMHEKELKRIIGHHIKQIPGVRGVNNHMGSYFTERRDKMAIVLDELKKRGLFYIDSRTTSQTVAHELATRMGVPAASRSVFLDNDLSSKSIRFQMERLLGIARHTGMAIGIGHPHRVTLEILKRYHEKLKTVVEIVPVSELVS